MKTSKKPLPKDPNKLAYEIVRISTEEEAVSEHFVEMGRKSVRARKTSSKSTKKATEQQAKPKPERSAISEYLAEIGRKGGLKGGRARAEKLTSEQRKEIAIKAAQSRWSKKQK